VIDGRLHHGSAGNGGEFGHVLVERNGRPCSCRRRGCIEAYASGTQIALRAQEALAAAIDEPRSALSGLTEITAAEVAAAAAEGDPLARRIWDETTDLLGSAITDLVNVFEPDLVVLGGGVTRSGAMLIDPIRQHVRDGAMGPAARTAKVEPAALGDAVCVVGAGAVALERVRGAAGV
jgi:glucokinase